MSHHTVDVIGIGFASNGILDFDGGLVDLGVVNAMWTIALPCWNTMICIEVTARCWQGVSKNWDFFEISFQSLI